VLVLGLPVETIETKFGGIPHSLPSPSLPTFSMEKIQAVFPDAITITLLGAIESLLCAVVADGVIGHRHRSNCELIAQGLANIGSIFFGGIPATGAIARTMANIKMGAKTPLAGIVHAVTLLLLMLFLAPAASKVPLPALAGVLVFVAWNMSELDHFFSILKGQRSDALVLMITFFLTVFIDLTVAVQVGVVLSAALFIKRMSDRTTIEVCQILLDENVHEHPAAGDSELLFRKDVPECAVVFEIHGPFFYAVADSLNEELRQRVDQPKVFILRMRRVPAIDATGIRALTDFAEKCRQKGIVFVLSGVQEPIARILRKTGVENAVGSRHIFKTIDEALTYARSYQKAGAVN
jgi:sulfate permease, SulP family